MVFTAIYKLFELQLTWIIQVRDLNILVVPKTMIQIISNP